MRKYIITLLAIMVAGFNSFAQDILRNNYLRNGYVYSACERALVHNGSKEAMPLYLKLSKVRVKDGSDLYIMRLDFVDKNPWKMPANAPLTITMASGKSLILKNSNNSPNLVAPEGISTDNGKLYWNLGEYYLDEIDLKKLVEGVSMIDATRRWSEDGHIKIAYKNNEFGSALAAQYDKLKSTPAPKSELGNNLRSLQDQHGSRLAESKVIPVEENLSVSMVYLYYAPSNNESYDLNLYIPGHTMPLGAEVKITTKSGNVINLKQEREMPSGRVLCYPTIDEVKDMAKGVSKISVSTIGSPVTFSFNSDEFSSIVDRLYNSLQSVSIL